MKLLFSKALLVLPFFTLILLGCEKNIDSPTSLHSRLQGTWSIQEVYFGQNKHLVDSSANYIGVTIEFEEDTMCWSRSNPMRIAKGLFEINSEEIATDPLCDDLNEDIFDDCDYETHYSIYAKLDFLHPNYLNNLDPVYVTSQYTGETKLFDVEEIEENGNSMTWFVIQNKCRYEYRMVKQ